MKAVQLRDSTDTLMGLVQFVIAVVSSPDQWSRAHGHSRADLSLRVFWRRLPTGRQFIRNGVALAFSKALLRRGADRYALNFVAVDFTRQITFITPGGVAAGVTNLEIFMPRIQAVDPADAPNSVAPALGAIQKAVGFVPNFYSQAAVSSAALNGYLAFNEALGAGVLPAATREAIALAVAEANRCNYCLSAHSAVAAGNQLLDVHERNLARAFESDDPRRGAALRFAKAVFEARGHIDDAELDDARAAGHSDAALLEIVAVVSINIYTNYLNEVAQLKVDFPLVEAGVHA